MKRAVDLVRGELERLFALEEMIELASRHLGLAANDVGGTSTKATFALALTRRCFLDDRVDALVDAVLHARRDVDPALRDVDSLLVPQPGDELAGFRLEEIVRRTDVGVIHRATKGGDARWDVHVLAPKFQRRAVQRFLTAHRLVASLDHPSLPREVVTSDAPALVAIRTAPGEPLAARRSLDLKTGLPIVRAIADALAAMHRAHLVHGGLDAESVIIDGERVHLVGFAVDRLHTPVGTSGDVLAFAVLARTLLGDASGSVELDMLLRHFSSEDRPDDATLVLREIATVGEPINVTVTSGEIAALAERLRAMPDDREAAIALQRAAGEGGDRNAIADILVAAALALDDSDRETAKALRFRAVRALRTNGTEASKGRAEGILAEIATRDPSDTIAMGSLEEIRKELGKYDELVEMLLARSQTAPSGAERARALSEIGRLYVEELDDPEQALLAYTRALCQEPTNDAHARAVEKLCRNRPEAWTEQLQTIAQAIEEKALGSATDEIALMLRAARWYEERLQRTDFALGAFREVIGRDPKNEDAARGIADIYRRGQQPTELVKVLLAWADVALVPSVARDARAEAAEAMVKLGEVEPARLLVERVLADDPEHRRAGDVRITIAEREDDPAVVVRVLQQRAASLPIGAERAAALVRAGRVLEEKLGDLGAAEIAYADAIAAPPTDATRNDTTYHDALLGLERVHSAQERHAALVGVLRQQLELATTPRRKIALHLRIAGLLGEELVDHGAAANELEVVVTLDPANVAALEGLVPHYRALERWDALAATQERLAALATDDARRIEHLLAQARVLEERFGAREALGAYRRVLAIAPAHTTAIEAVTRLMDEGGDTEGAIEQFRHALDVNPADAVAAGGLRKALTERGDWAGVVALVEKELSRADSDLARARLWVERARIESRELGDQPRAEASAQRALELDPANAEALVLLGDAAYAKGKIAQARKLYGELVPRAGALAKFDAVRVLVRFLDTSETKDALGEAATSALSNLVITDAALLAEAAEAIFAHGDPQVAYRMYGELLGKARAPDRGRLLARMGESARRAGMLDRAVEPLREAALLGEATAFRSLALVYDAAEDWAAALEVRRARVPSAPPDERFELLLEIGDILARSGDPDAAADAYSRALEDRPDDRRLLNKLMQVHSDQRAWDKVLAIVLRLANFVDAAPQRAKYMQTAAAVAAEHLGDETKALEYYRRALALDPSLEAALDEAVALHRKRGEMRDAERLLQAAVERSRGDETRMVTLLDRLGEVYAEGIGDADLAIDAWEAAQAFAIDDARAEKLARLYAADAANYLDRAVLAQSALIAKDPYRLEAYQTLRKLYTEAKRADPSWCLCQTLTILRVADPDEEAFYEQHRSRNAAPAKASLDDADWASLAHGDLDPLLTRIFAILEPSIARARTEPLESLGLDAKNAVDPRNDPSAVVKTLHYAEGVLGLPSVRLFRGASTDGLVLAHARTPAIVFGTMLGGNQELAFHAGRTLAALRPGHWVRHLLPTGTGLRAWLFAAIRLSVPHFSIPGDLAGPVGEATQALVRDFVGSQKEAEKERLASAVSKLLAGGGALDLKKWVAAVDLTHDRVGFLLAHDLQVTTETIRETESSVAVAERMKAIVVFSVSEAFFALREKLGIVIGA